MLVVSTGLGTNSTAMLVGMRERGIVPGLILFADTGGEKPHTYLMIDVMNEWLSVVGFPQITVVKRVDKNGDVLTLEANCIDRKMLPSVAYGYKTCSQKFKIQPQEKFANNYEPIKSLWRDGQKVTKAVGFDADEPQRALIDYSNEKYNYWYPLIEWDWGREECIEAIGRAGLPQPGKSSCYFCPNNRPSEIREMAANYPELMVRAIQMEENANLTSLAGLGRRFSWKSLIKNGELFDFPNIDMPCGCYD